MLHSSPFKFTWCKSSNLVGTQVDLLSRGVDKVVCDTGEESTGGWDCGSDCGTGDEVVVSCDKLWRSLDLAWSG